MKYKIKNKIYDYPIEYYAYTTIFFKSWFSEIVKDFDLIVLNDN